MPLPKHRKKHESLGHRLEAVIIRIPVTSETLAAVATLTTTIIALAQVVKLPLEVEKVVPLEAEKAMPIKIVPLPMEILPLAKVNP